MDDPTGAPEPMAAKQSELTPMLSQYLQLCLDHEEAIVLFQVGDFYEAFCEAAEAVARICEVTLTKREDSTGTYPMAGIPIDNAASYLERLLDAGYRVAIADQVEDADASTGLVDRAVTQVLTPGTIVDETLLAAGTTNYLVAIAADESTDTTDTGGPEQFAIAAIDVSTGEWFVVPTPDTAALETELRRIDPAEVLVGPSTADIEAIAADSWAVSQTSRLEATAPNDRLDAYDTAALETDLERRACAAVVGYAEYTQGDDGALGYVGAVRRETRHERLRLDGAALASLELFETRERAGGATLFETIDATSSALGRRCLERWLRRPLVDRAAIESRLSAVEALAGASIAREELRDGLADAYDLERLAGRLSRERANARDLRSLASTLAVVPELRAALEPLSSESEAIAALADRLDPLSAVRERIEAAIRPDPPIEITDGGVIREGFDEDLDNVRATAQNGREWVSQLEKRERERTGIDSLAVGHNQVHGYYIEVTNPNLEHVPEEYTRRQTLKNAERFYTPELKAREDEIFAAEERAESLEYELFTSLREELAGETDRITALAGAIGELDALCSLASTAVDRDYVRPTVADPGTAIRIEGGRHPVVESTEREFVPNDTDLARGEIAIITGPNMSGKSTYMRQVALIVLLTQLGSFVPAEAARVPIVDRLFTRVGASDDIAGGQSTFMREMTELTDILTEATDRSLVLLDEVGRGTSTTDGRAIAAATTGYIHDEIGATTLFATHYHELTALESQYDRVVNRHFAATREGESVTFLHRIARGGSSASYGIEVARMAGVPEAVVEEAYAIVDEEVTETEETVSPSRDGDRSPAGSASGSETDPDGGDSEAETLAEIAAELESLDIARTTPIEALTLLDSLQSKLR